jgi:hypothetical protein
MGAFRHTYRPPRFFMQPHSREMWGPAPPYDFEDNGCTFSPDGWWHKACRWHDYHYSEHCDIPRILADLYFFLNLWKCRAPFTVCCGYPFVTRWKGKTFYSGKGDPE